MGFGKWRNNKQLLDAFFGVVVVEVFTYCWNIIDSRIVLFADKRLKGIHNYEWEAVQCGRKGDIRAEALFV